MSPEALATILSKALAGGDVSTVILPAYDLDEARFQALAEAAVPVVQAAGAAALIVNDSRIAGRVKADGLHIEGNTADIIDGVKAHTPKFIVGGGDIRNRHSALEIGEEQPDYLMFGKLGADKNPEAHPRNLELADWWATMVDATNSTGSMTSASTSRSSCEKGRASVRGAVCRRASRGLTSSEIRRCAMFSARSRPWLTRDTPARFHVSIRCAAAPKAAPRSNGTERGPRLWGAWPYFGI